MHKSLLIILLAIAILSPHQIIYAAREHTAESLHSSEPRTIPTTLNPTGNGLPGVRSIANPSFEDFDFPYTWASYATIAEEHMRGWYTTHPLKEEYYDNIKVSVTQHRLIEIQNIIPAHGSYHAELNAWFKSMVYQPICLSSGETFTYEFYHTSKPGNRTDIVEFRLGIPSGLPTGSRSADSYSRQIIVANTTTNVSNQAISVTNNTVNHPIPSGTTLTSATIENNWGKYRGTHTLPASGWTGVYNLGFNAIAGATNELGNFLDGITIGLNPIVDFGTSRDTAGNESSSPPSINIRINGRVAANTKFMLQMAEGDATPDVDFTLGAVSAGAYGTATSVHVTGSNNWLITIPAGDYDGGVVPANNKGGLTIPVTYTSDSTIEPTEYMFFKLLFPGKLGSSTNWVLGDPTCDGSRKIDGVVYSIVDVGPTSTPVPTATLTPSRTPSPTFTLTPTNTNTPTFTPSRTPTPSPTPTLSPTFTTSPTFTITPTFTRTSTITPSPNPYALKDVAVGASFSMGVMHNGSLVTWGFNRDGQATIPTWMRGVRIKEVEAGSNWVVVLTESGSVTGWGKNDFGQLTIPAAARSGVTHISAFYGHVIALKSNGTAVLWGRNNEKQLNMPAITYKLKDVSAGHTHTLAVTEDETIIGWGNPYLVQPKFIEPLGGIKAVSAGFDHSLALTNWGTVVCWRSTDPNPRNTQDVGQCDPIHKSLYNIVAISAGKQYSLALDKNGIVYAWGLNNRGQATIPKNAPRAAIIESGYVNSVIGYQDASIRAIGEATHGALITRTPTRTP